MQRGVRRSHAKHRHLFEPIRHVERQVIRAPDTLEAEARPILAQPLRGGVSVVFEPLEAHSPAPAFVLYLAVFDRVCLKPTWTRVA